MKIKKVYLGRKQIRPDDEGWQPGENTYAYYPLIANANDTSGNNRNLTAHSSITYSTENGAFLPNSRHTGMLEPFNISTTSHWTFSRWQDTLGLAGQTDARGIDIFSGGNYRINTARANGTQGISYNTSSSTIVSVSAPVNTWHLYTITIGANRQIKLYADGVIKNTGTVNSFTSQYFRWGQEYNNANPRQLYGHIKDIIIESKARTDEEISDYFNQTKGDYGL